MEHGLTVEEEADECRYGTRACDAKANTMRLSEDEEEDEVVY